MVRPGKSEASWHCKQTKTELVTKGVNDISKEKQRLLTSVNLKRRSMGTQGGAILSPFMICSSQQLHNK